MDNFEEAVIIVFSQDTSIPSTTKQDAYNLCTEIRNSTLGWKLCMDEFLKSNYIEVQFWCLQVVNDHVASIDTKSRQEIITKLVEYLQSTSIQLSNYAVASKFCLLYVRLVQLDYPQRWPTAFSVLLNMVQSNPSTAGIYTKILLMFDQEIVEEFAPRTVEERNQNALVKDAVRSNDIEAIALSWYNILCNWKAAKNDVVVNVLQIIGKYISWIDISLIANEQFLPLLFSFLEPNNPYTEQAFDCVAAVICKRMDAFRKITLLSKYEVLDSLLLHIKADSADIMLLSKQAETLDTIGMQILEAFVSLRDEYSKSNATAAGNMVTESWKMLEKLLKVTMSILSTSDMPACMGIMLFSTEFFGRLKTFVSKPETLSPSSLNTGSHNKNRREDILIPIEVVAELLRNVLSICLKKVAYPDWFNFEHDDLDDAHCSFEEFRKATTKLFTAAYVVNESVSLEWLKGVVLEMCDCAPQLTITQIESVIYILCTAGQQYKDLLKDMKRPNHPFNSCLQKICSCSTLMHSEHSEIRIILLSLFVRYSHFFQLNASYIPVVLESMLDLRGLFSHHARVVSQTATMLLRFIKRTLSSCEIYTEQIIRALRTLLELSHRAPKVSNSAATTEDSGGSDGLRDLALADQLLLYEAVGCLIGGHNLSDLKSYETKKLFLREILAPITSQLQTLSNTSKLGTPNDIVSVHIQAMAALSKGFSSKSNDFREEWSACLAITHHALQTYRESLDVRQAALFFCRRMLSVLGQVSLDTVCVIIRTMYEAQGFLATEFNELGLFVIHLVVTFKEAVNPFLEIYFFRIFELHYEHWMTLKDDSPELAREKNEVQRLLCQICFTISIRSPSILHRYCDGFSQSMVFKSDVNASQHTILHPSWIVPNFLVACLSSDSTCNTNALMYAVDTWINLVKFALQSPRPEEAIACIPLTQILNYVLSSLVTLNLDEVGDVRVVQEACNLLILVLQRNISVANDSIYLKLYSEMQSKFFDAFVTPAKTERFTDGQLLRQKLVEGHSSEERCETLKQWIKKQQQEYAGLLR